MSNHEPKHMLYNSIEKMIAPETLSRLLGKHITQVVRSEPSTWGNAGSEFSVLETDGGRLILKTMSRMNDWIMFSTNDFSCRSAMLWQHGLLDELSSDLGHVILACASDQDVWAILMQDLSGRFLWENSQDLPELPSLFLDALARLHARFWNDSRLRQTCLGLGSPAQLFQLSSPTFAQEHMSDRWSWIPAACIEGWKLLGDRLDADVFLTMKQLIENPRPLLEAISRYPYTLLHGDYWEYNLAHGESGQPIAVDWQLAMCSLMTIDLGRVTSSFYLDANERLPAETYYRSRLEGYLSKRFEDKEWQAMIDLGYLVEVLWLRCYTAHWREQNVDDPDARRSADIRLALCNQQVRDGIRWL